MTPLSPQVGAGRLQGEGGDKRERLVSLSLRTAAGGGAGDSTRV